MATLRVTETEEQTAKRRLKDRENKSLNREAETEEQHNLRKQTQKKRTTEHRKACSANITDVTRHFQEKVKIGPDFVCISCHRMLYRDVVQLYKKEQYMKLPNEKDNAGKQKESQKKNTEMMNILHAIEPFLYTSNDGNLWICKTCHRALQRCQIPSQSLANGLALDKVPKELSKLNNIEVRLLSQRIPFMKIVALPSGRQKAIHGPAINVVSNIDTICTVLPRLPKQLEFIPMKLKRKLIYKGYYMFDSVNIQSMTDALGWLKQNNSLYSDIRINYNWKQQSIDEDQELWEALSRLTVENEPGAEIKSKKSKSCKPSKSQVSVDLPVQLAVHPKVPSVIVDSCAEFDLLFQQMGYFVEHVVGDGNCFFHAIVKQTEQYGMHNQYHKNYSRLRTDIADYLEAHPNGPAGNIPYRNFLVDRTEPHVRGDVEPACLVMDNYVEQVGDETERQELRWQRYLSDLHKGAWADEVTVRATADYLHVEILIIGTNNPDNPTLIVPTDGNVTARFYLGHIGQVHYVSLKSNQLPEIQNILPDAEHGQILKADENASYTLQQPTDTSCLAPQKFEVSYISENYKRDCTKEPETLVRKCKSDSNFKVCDNLEFEQSSEAFETACKLKGRPFETCLQLEDFDVNQMISVAPGEGNKPINILTDEKFEEMAFPHRYPYGRGGFSQKRKQNLSVRKYFNQRLLDVDGRFASDIEYLLAAQYAVELNQVEHLPSIVIRQMSGRLFQGKKLTAGDLKDPQKLDRLVKNDQAYRLLRDIRGTPAYWQKIHYEVLAMVRQLGIPTFFLTLSAADMRWPDVIQTIARQYGTILTDEQVTKLTAEEKWQWIRSNPVTAARHFQYRLDVFWNEFLKSDAKPIGEVIDFMKRIEFQARGSPHAHCIIWIKDAPKYSQEPDNVVTDFIDKYQTCNMPDNDPELEELVKLQEHTCTDRCKRNGTCRFGLPKLPSPKTLISCEPDEQSDKTQKLQKAKEIYIKVNDTMTDIECLDNVLLEDLLQASNISMDDYIEALQTSKRGNTVVLKRQPSEKDINSYNPHILRAFRSNMDIQYILDAYACVMYVTSYMMKSERAMGELLRHVSKEMHAEDIKTQLRKLGSTFLNHREVSAQEATYRILSLPLSKKSRKCIFVNTDAKDERVAMAKPLSMIKNLENEEEDFYLLNLTDRYVARPNSLENMCLAEFGANYDVLYKETTNDENDHTPDPADAVDNQAEKAREIITLQYGLGKMHKRSIEAIIRFPKHKTDTEKYYRAKLVLYTPWRDENHLIGQSETYFDECRLHLAEINEMEQKYTQNGPTFEEAMQDLNENGPPVHAFAQIAPNAEHQRAEEEAEGLREERHMEQEDLDQNEEMIVKKHDNPVGQRFDTQKDTRVMSAADYQQKMQQLNDKQRRIVSYHRIWCKSVVEATRNNKEIPKPYRAFISGPGGVGKSHVIELLKHDTISLLRNLPSVQPEDIICLLCAPTGTAAFNISGMTLHSTFLIPIAMRQYRSLAADTMNTLRNKLMKVKVLIIDEISMVGSDMLYTLHRRLEDIKGSTCSDSTFGNMTVIAVGDLYQLPPVRTSHVFDQPKDIYAKLVDPLWYQFRLAELTQIMRQKDDLTFAELLNRVRTASFTNQDIAVLKSRESDLKAKNYPVDVLHIYSQNVFVDKHNAQMLTKVENEIFTLKAIDSKKDRNSGIEIKLPENSRDTGGLDSELKVAVGCRVMMIYNVDVSDGLSNGATGTVAHIAQVGDAVINILIQFDNESVGRKAKQQSHYKEDFPNAVPVSRQEAVFNIGVRKCISATRRQFPLRLCWACTIHKVQGLTVDNIVVSFEGRFFPGQAYVALSRVKTLHGLHILNFDSKKIIVDKNVIKEMERLRENRLYPVDGDLNSSQNDRHILLSHLNIRGIKSHTDDLKQDKLMLQSDIICFCETKLRIEEKFGGVSLGRPDMKTFRIDRAIPRLQHAWTGSGGILVAVREDLAPELLTSNVKPCIEYVAIRLLTINLCVVGVYRSPTGDKCLFCNEIENLLQTYIRDMDCVIVGDINEDLLQTKGVICSMLQQKQFQQKTASATRDSGSLLDHTYVRFTDSEKTNKVEVAVTDTYYSDHDIVSVTLAKS